MSWLRQACTCPPGGCYSWPGLWESGRWFEGAGAGDGAAGYGPQKLQVLASYALRKVLMTWLTDFKAVKEVEQKKREERERMRVCPPASPSPPTLPLAASGLCDPLAKDLWCPFPGESFKCL